MDGFKSDAKPVNRVMIVAFKHVGILQEKNNNKRIVIKCVKKFLEQKYV